MAKIKQEGYMSRTNLQISNKQLDILRDAIQNIIDERLKDYILVPKNRYFIDEQGYKYVFTKSSFTPLKETFLKELQSAQKEIENSEIIEHKELWEKVGI